MKSYDSRVYSINDFTEWDNQGQLTLNPFFQRRPVWSDNAKSYLMDTIIREKPIPKIFIRQKVNVTTQKTIRDVVDGQQRLRTILSFIKDGFVISRRLNREFGGQHFSQLPEAIQAQVLSYEISVDLLINLPDSEILDIFSRLNSYSVILNQQEKLNATHFGEFKILADEIGRKYNEYWIEQKILTARQILRMQEVHLVADVLIAMREGIKSKKQIGRYYSEYEKEFSDNTSKIEASFDRVIEVIRKIYPEGLSESEFRRPHLFYSLFIAVAHCCFTVPGLKFKPIPLHKPAEVETARNGLDRVGVMFESELRLLKEAEQQFMQDSRRATTDETVRKRRTLFLLSLMK